MTAFFEQRLHFAFGASWRVEKYDEHPVFKGGIEPLKEELSCEHCKRATGVGSKGVDFVGRRAAEDALYLIEVKDFRGHEVENRRRLREALAIEVAVKVRDTLAGLVGAHYARGEPSLRAFAPQTSPGVPKVLVWLERDASRVEQRGDPTLELRHAVEHKLHWLAPRVMVVSADKVWPALDLTVRSVPHRVQRGEESTRATR